MFAFEKAAYIWWLPAIIVPGWIFFRYLYYRRETLKKIGNTGLVEKLFSGFSEEKHKKHGVRMGIIGVLSILALANPQWGESNEAVKSNGIDLMIALDISQSMWAEDVKPDRLQKAKVFIQRLTEKMPGSRIGLIVFAGEAYLETPLTVDKGAFKLFMKSVSPDMLSEQGTAIDKAIETGITAFENQKSASKVLLIVSDGESHEGGAESMAAEAKSKDILIYTAGIGTSKGGTIPNMEMGQKNGIKTDNNGEAVVSSLNEGMLETIAEEGGGKYFLLTNEISDAKKIASEFDKLEKGEAHNALLKNRKSWFPVLIFAVMLILLWDSGLKPGRKK